MAADQVDPEIVTPVKGPGLLGGLLSGQHLPAAAARLGARIAGRTGKPLRIAGRIVAVRHAHVCELLRRDLDFGIAEVNQRRVDEVNGGPFVLGEDRSVRLERERRALYAALAHVDTEPLRDAVAREAEQAVRAVPAGGRIDAVGDYARPIAARTARRLFGLESVPEDWTMEVSRSVFAHTFLNQGDDPAVRERGVRAGAYMAGWLADEIARRRASGRLGSDLMGALLRQELLDDDGARRTLGGMFVGSIDTTATAVAKVIKVASRDPALAAAMRRDAGDLDRMLGWCNEALRRWPHNPVLLRKARADTVLGGRRVKRGEVAVAWTQAAMQDATAFPDPARLRPDRDGAAYLHLGAGLHPCAGRPVNRFQIPLLVAGLAARGLGEVGPVRWAGPFPHRLDVTLEGGI